MTAPSWHVEPSGYQAKVLRQRENGDSDGEFEKAWDGTGQVHCAPCTLAAKFHLANLEAAAREGSGDERGQAYAAAQRLLEAARNWHESPNQPVADPDPDTPHGAFGNRNAASVAEHEAALLQRCLPYGKHAGITPGRSDHTRMLEAVIHACTGILHEMRREEHHERMAAHEALRQGRVAPGDCSPEALTRSGQGDFHHPAPPLMCLVATPPISARQPAAGEAGSVPAVCRTAPT